MMLCLVSLTNNGRIRSSRQRSASEGISDRLDMTWKYDSETNGSSYLVHLNVFFVNFFATAFVFFACIFSKIHAKILLRLLWIFGMVNNVLKENSGFPHLLYSRQVLAVLNDPQLHTVCKTLV
mmetsp:Transcript_2680/g.3402  ORF Transcript_2680/g.3402 Transcript_2680/m.3402 type:complete len:123 (+) Transcript_2680:935-1303(+)